MTLNKILTIDEVLPRIQCLRDLTIDRHTFTVFPINRDKYFRLLIVLAPVSYDAIEVNYARHMNHPLPERYISILLGYTMSSPILLKGLTLNEIIGLDTSTDDGDYIFEDSCWPLNTPIFFNEFNLNNDDYQDRLEKHLVDINKKFGTNMTLDTEILLIRKI